MILTMEKIEKKLNFFVNNPAISLAVIGIVGLFFRQYYFPYNVPLTQDALATYFFYATDTSVLGHLPANLNVANNGWPVFLSVFFTIFRFENVIDYMNLQREITVLISVLTIVPIYFLCRRFFDKQYAIIGAAIFSFEPRIIQNSLLGLTEPLYIILITLSLVLFFNSNKKMVYASFGIIAVAVLVRSEGFFVFFPMLIMFFMRYRSESNRISKCILAAAIFALVMIPMAILRIKTRGNDALTSRLLGTSHDVLSQTLYGGNSSFHIITVIENITKFSAWSMIPIFIFFIPIGVFLIFRKRNLEKISVIIIIISMLIPVFYEFSFIPDTRYIYPLFPLFIIISLLSVKELTVKTKKQNIILVLIISGILIASTSFLDIKKYDYNHQIEAFHIAQHIDNIASGINSYYPEDDFILAAEIPEKWPFLSSTIKKDTVIIPTDNFDSITNYIESSEKKGLSHLVIDENSNRPDFLQKIIHHEKDYPYLIEKYNSTDNGYKYHVIIYKIDYQKFESLNKIR